MPSRSSFSAAVGMLCAAALGAGCTEPQSGLLTKTWCHPTAAENQPTVMLDDLEDGDAAPCEKGAAHWFVDGNGTLTPTPGTDALPVDLPAGDPAWSRAVPSLRAQHLHGALSPGGWARLALPLANPDLTAFQTVDFWAHADSQSLTIRFAVKTASASEDDYFGGDVDLTATWGSSVISYPLIGAALTRPSDGAVATDVDLAGATDILFDYRPPAGAADFGFWIDDVQLKRK